ncbi:hypothetical protein B0H13DRAFT_2067718, partial [Mycena leptocephala]
MHSALCRWGRYERYVGGHSFDYMAHLLLVGTIQLTAFFSSLFQNIYQPHFPFSKHIHLSCMSLSPSLSFSVTYWYTLVFLPVYSIYCVFFSLLRGSVYHYLLAGGFATVYL